MNWWDKVRLRAQSPKKWMQGKQTHFWSGVSLLVFKYGTADDPIRIRLNIITILFSILIIISLPSISILNVISDLWQPGEEINTIQSRVLMTMHIKTNLDKKRKLFLTINDQLNSFQYQSSRDSQSIIQNLFSSTFRSMEEIGSIKQAGQKHYNLQLFYHLHNQGKSIFGQKTYHSIHPVWHRLTLYHAMPRGRPLPAGAGMITSGFGKRENPTEISGNEFHTGIDFGDAPGTPLIATASGRVFKANEDPTQGYGNHVRIHHGFGITTLYAHCQSLAVSQGQFVKKGQIIGYLGKTGRATGHHIHYEIAYGNEPSSNPLEFIQMR